MSAQRVLPIPRSMRRRLARPVRKSHDAAEVVRVLIVLRSSDGMGTSETAKLVGRIPATVVRVLQRFRRLGESALRDCRCVNGVTKVDADAL